MCFKLNKISKEDIFTGNERKLHCALTNKTLNEHINKAQVNFMYVFGNYAFICFTRIFIAFFTNSCAVTIRWDITILHWYMKHGARIWSFMRMFTNVNKWLIEYAHCQVSLLFDLVISVHLLALSFVNVIQSSSLPFFGSHIFSLSLSWQCLISSHLFRNNVDIRVV